MKPLYVLSAKNRSKFFYYFVKKKVMGKNSQSSAVVITGIGMVTSLGHDFRTSCAAHRAGLSGVSELVCYESFNEDGSALFVHQIPAITSGFQGYARLLRIGNAALKDLLNFNDFETFHKSRIGMFLALPNSDRVNPKPLVQPGRSQNMFDGKIEGAKDVQALGTKLGNSFLPLINSLPSQKTLRLFDVGHSGVIFAIKRAMDEIKEGELDSCVVGGLDSFLDPVTLGWLNSNNRLKTDNNDQGVFPGEAGAFLLLESKSHAMKRGVNSLGDILGASEGCEQNHFYSGGQALGEGLASSIDRLISKVKINSSSPCWIISDQNGEPFRANDWGHALVRLKVSNPGLAESTVTLPANSFGDTGACSGAVAICIAVKAFLRNYFLSEKVLILSASDSGERAGLFLCRPNTL